jgi:transposase
MSKHKSEDYKITAVKYYLENETNYTKTCDIFKCSERSLKRWIERYEELEEILNDLNIYVGRRRKKM